MDGRLNATFSLFNVERKGTGVLDRRYPESYDVWAGSCCYQAQGKVCLLYTSGRPSPDPRSWRLA